MAEAALARAIMARELLELLREAEDYGALKALSWVAMGLDKAENVEDVRAIIEVAVGGLNELMADRFGRDHALGWPERPSKRGLWIPIPRDLWLKVREAAKRLGREPEDLIAEAVRQFKAELEARKRIWLPPDLYAKIEALAKAKGKRPEDVVAELLELAKDRLEDLMEPDGSEGTQAPSQDRPPAQPQAA